MELKINVQVAFLKFNGESCDPKSARAVAVLQSKPILLVQRLKE